MPSKISLLNKEIILQIIRSTGWISIVYFLGLFFALPLRMIMLYSDEKERLQQYGPVNNLFEYNFEIQFVLMMVIPILLSIFLFRFLHVKEAADLLHSLPLRRGKIFHHYSLSGIMALFLPLFLIALIVLFVHSVLDLSIYFQVKDIFYWFGVMILLNMLLFIVGIFVAMMTGISAVQAVLTYIMLLFPVGFTVLSFTNLKYFLFGFPGDYYLNDNVLTLSPLTYATELQRRIVQWNEVGVYVALIFIFYGLSLYFYKKRKIESASEAIAFVRLRGVFKYGVTFCTMLLGGMYFGEVQNNSTFWTIFGYLIGTVIGYYIAEMLLQKTWRVFHHLKGLFLYVGIVIVLIGVVQTLGFYENKVPEQDEVKNVILADSPYGYGNQEFYSHLFVPLPLEENKNIEAVRKLHQQIIDDKKVNIDLAENEYLKTAFFLYELNNGKKVIRQYRVHEKIYEDLYKPIYESSEYKVASNEIFHIDVESVNHVSFRANGPGKRDVIIHDQEELKELIKVLQADNLNESHEDSVYFSGRGSMIEFFIGDNYYLYLHFKPTYNQLNQWLEERNLLKQTRVVPDDLSSIEIVKWDSIEFTHHEDISGKIANSDEVMKITDKEQMDEVLNNAGWGPVHQYIAVLHYEGTEHTEILYIDEPHSPDFVRSYFN
ncbi:DUF6449 domain-containing protein [Bacillus sp. B15-48]|uniref:DUF6449 domain-containing protein n=1 Tax=Bacillus sp. B15-48 TaxID=1548601 RepID=UPI00193F570D|nr:DUF6449 domain-containing protein [Bacillus sp. B15-48]MBM4762760.1 multidrug ABC transporter permease [Bacillus sp. B15-48]